MKPSADIAMHFGRNLARCRKRAGLSQEELGYRAQIHRTEVSLLERGARTPRADTIVKLAGGISVPVAELLDGLTYRPAFIGLGEGRYEVDRPPSNEGQAAASDDEPQGKDRRRSAEPRRG